MAFLPLSSGGFPPQNTLISGQRLLLSLDFGGPSPRAIRIILVRAAASFLPYIKRKCKKLIRLPGFVCVPLITSSTIMSRPVRWEA